ncbi:FecR family protein [Aquimarina sediminis]|uniref:FecR family protein n=1 Tax=Aquimarina sediminis TaxID=2070536 RepID=UPI000CA04AAE|nr:FecR family protein [Aquimarina sediminis]
MNKEYLIKKWLADELTEVEKKAFEELDDYDFHIKMLQGAKQFKAPDTYDVEGLDEVYSKHHTQKQNTTKRIGLNNSWLRIAATVIVILGITSLLFLSKDTVVNTSIGEKIAINLPDGSEVMLNSMSSLSYNKNRWDKIRKVNLEGEAFFKVSKGNRFDVVTPFGNITVLGTQFNVKNRENYFEVTCFEGLVSVSKENNGYTKNIPAGSSFKVVNDVISFEKNLNSFPSWTTNKSSFKSVPFKEVIEEFRRQYDVTFSFDNIDLQRIFTGGFVHNSLQDGLNSITLPLDLSYTIDTSNHITIQKLKK